MMARGEEVSPEKSALVRAGLNAVSNSDYAAHTDREAQDAENYLKEIQSRAKTQVASCWGQFYVVSEAVREQQAQAQISEMVEKEIGRFRAETQRAERDERARIERVYAAITANPYATPEDEHRDRTKAIDPSHDRMRPLFYTTDVLVPDEQALSPRVRNAVAGLPGLVPHVTPGEDRRPPAYRPPHLVQPLLPDDLGFDRGAAPRDAPAASAPFTLGVPSLQQQLSSAARARPGPQTDPSDLATWRGRTGERERTAAPHPHAGEYAWKSAVRGDPPSSRGSYAVGDGPTAGRDTWKALDRGRDVWAGISKEDPELSALQKVYDRNVAKLAHLDSLFSAA
jgi:hypothetical protein